MKHGELATYSSNALDRLDAVRMHPGDRSIAKACLRESALLADVFMWPDTQLRRVLACAGQALGVLARCSKVRAVTPESN